jgi:hypothetical protein
MVDFLSSLFGGSPSNKEEEEALARQDAERASLRDTTIYEQSRQNQLNEDINFFFAQQEKNIGGVKDRDPNSSSISKQISHIVDMGYYARPTRFFFEIDGLPANINARLNRNCVNTNIPGRAFQSQPQKIYGAPREFVYELNYANEISMSFRVGQDMFERNFFETWMHAIASPMSGDLEYPTNYRKSMRIFQLNRTDTKVLGVELYDVFCKNIGDIDLNTEASDQITTLTVSLGYSEYQIMGKSMIAEDIFRKERSPRASQLANRTAQQEGLNIPRAGFSDAEQNESMAISLFRQDYFNPIRTK